MAPQLPTMRWSTDAVAPRERLDYWVGAVCECFLEMDASSTEREGFGAAVTSLPLHALRINHVQGSSQDVYRTQRGIARGRDNFYYLLCKEDTPCGVVQQGVHADRLLPGDLALIDSRTPCELHFPDTVDTWSLQLPIEWLDTWLPQAQSHLGRRINGRRGFGLALSAFVCELGAGHGSNTGVLPDAVLADQLGALLALALQAAPDGAGNPVSHRDLAARIDACVAERCGEPGLGAAEVAATLNISVRTLHRALAGSRQTFAARLLHHRLQAARRMLTSPVFDRVTVAEIGRRAGLLDPSHFTRLCRRALGAAPSELRADRLRDKG